MPQVASTQVKVEAQKCYKSFTFKSSLLYFSISHTTNIECICVCDGTNMNAQSSFQNSSQQLLPAPNPVSHFSHNTFQDKRTAQPNLGRGPIPPPYLYFNSLLSIMFPPTIPIQ